MTNQENEYTIRDDDSVSNSLKKWRKSIEQHSNNKCKTSQNFIELLKDVGATNIKRCDNGTINATIKGIRYRGLYPHSYSTIKADKGLK